MKRCLRGLALPFLLGLVLPGLAGCVEADLGEVPLLCNPGEPHCPKGYSCVRYKEHDYCLREGANPNRLSALVDRGLTFGDSD